MRVAVYSTRAVGPSAWQVRGIAGGKPRTVTFPHEGEPSMAQCIEALGGEAVEQTPAAKTAGTPVPTPLTPPADAVMALLTGNVKVVTERLSEVQDVVLLNDAAAAESERGNRVTVLAAITTRIAALQAEA